MEISETAWLVPVQCQWTAAKFTLGPHTFPLTLFSVAVKRADKQRKSHPCQKAHGSLSISINCMLQSGHWDKGLSKGGTRRGESTSDIHLTYWTLTMAKDCEKKITNRIVLWFECTSRFVLKLNCHCYSVQRWVGHQGCIVLDASLPLLGVGQLVQIDFVIKQALFVCFLLIWVLYPVTTSHVGRWDVSAKIFAFSASTLLP